MIYDTISHLPGPTNWLGSSQTAPLYCLSSAAAVTHNKAAKMQPPKKSCFLVTTTHMAQMLSTPFITPTLQQLLSAFCAGPWHQLLFEQGKCKTTTSLVIYVLADRSRETIDQFRWRGVS